MFTAAMTHEELEKEAYQDYIEMNWKVQNAFAKYRRKVSVRAEDDKYFIPSTAHNITCKTRRHNTWHVEFHTYIRDNEGHIAAGYCCYYILHRGDAVEYLFIREGKKNQFILERITDHFLQRYKERYLIPNKVNLKGMSAALYFERHSDDMYMAKYMPKGWTNQDLEERDVWVSGQGMFVTSFKGRTRTFITFLDQENLSSFKAQIYEEESFMRLYDVKGAPDVKIDSIEKAFNLYELYHKPNSREIIKRMAYRMYDETEPDRKAKIKKHVEAWDRLGAAADVIVEKVTAFRKKHGDDAPIIY